MKHESTIRNIIIVIIINDTAVEYASYFGYDPILFLRPRHLIYARIEMVVPPTVREVIEVISS